MHNLDKTKSFGQLVQWPADGRGGNSQKLYTPMMIMMTMVMMMMMIMTRMVLVPGSVRAGAARTAGMLTMLPLSPSKTIPCDCVFAVGSHCQLANPGAVAAASPAIL